MNAEKCKGFILLCLIAIMLVGCTSNPQDNEPLEVDIYEITSSMEENEELNQQSLFYEIHMNYSDRLEMDNETVEPLIAGWIEERLIEQEISDFEELDDNKFRIKGKITFNSKELSQEEIIQLLEQDASIQGVYFQTADGTKYQAAKVGTVSELIEIKETDVK
ncbi:hypothetical protein [Sutcliffiella deserti]|uniref:hypothetical protein n=1 Tax=Sutcliffiella deserti TaxID=2875501 RepID=UPI001CBCE071|nr:hypothetical protein [Sutcliffiella deserti]